MLVRHRRLLVREKVRGGRAAATYARGWPFRRTAAWNAADRAPDLRLEPGRLLRELDARAEVGSGDRPGDRSAWRGMDPSHGSDALRETRLRLRCPIRRRHRGSRDAHRAGVAADGGFKLLADLPVESRASVTRGRSLARRRRAIVRESQQRDDFRVCRLLEHLIPLTNRIEWVR